MKGCKRLHCSGFAGCVEVRDAYRGMEATGVFVEVDARPNVLAAAEGKKVKVHIGATVEMNPVDCLLLTTEPEKLQRN